MKNYIEIKINRDSLEIFVKCILMLILIGLVIDLLFIGVFEYTDHHYNKGYEQGLRDGHDNFVDLVLTQEEYLDITFNNGTVTKTWKASKSESSNFRFWGSDDLYFNQDLNKKEVK